MIIPKYWAEHKERRKCNTKSITVKRMGWSDVTQYEAEKMAQNRVDEAFKKIDAGEKVVFIEKRVAYNGTEGMPIREEILNEVGEAVITRNIYGAQCLNVKDVLFIDIDYDLNISSYMWKGIIWIGIVAALFLSVILRNGYILSVVGILLVIGSLLKKKDCNNYNKEIENIERKNLERVKLFCEKNSEFKFRVYKTPAGMRLLAINDLYNPKDETTVKVMKELGSDSNYIQMCINQNCFRARVSPKPWRINLKESLPHKTVIWPYTPEKLEARQKWVDKYELKSQNYAACKYIQTIGTGDECRDALRIQELHDELSRANEDLPIA